MLRGLSTISFFADDLNAARTWYSEFLGSDPYFERPGYIEFRLGDYQQELGIIDSKYAPTKGQTTAAPTTTDIAGKISEATAELVEAKAASPSTSSGYATCLTLPVVSTAAGAIVYWHVDDLNTTYERLLTMGAHSHQPIIVRGEGFVTASVVDPFGNVLGIMYNRHYLSILHGGSHSEPSLEAQTPPSAPVLEIVHFRVKAEVTDGQVLAASAETQQWLGTMPGYLGRELNKTDDGLWIDIVRWRSQAEANAAAAQIMAQPCATTFMALLDPQQVAMFHGKQQQQFGK